ncbi:3,4-dihydroxy-2-butanone-4-phosphate synthase [Candidatus Methylocalor cossyra]|uniref:3,4-dihydroxy-2-butanone 4-phosphate synthase n=1 Tax=Candidatus Methylocalor cossyra TaxID=3108543 RepID=A0ABM9NN36_9GAMM
MDCFVPLSELPTPGHRAGRNAAAKPSTGITHPAVAVIGNGAFVMVAADSTPENTGVLVMGAEKVTPDALAFLMQHTAGVVAVALPEDRLEALCLATGMNGIASVNGV